MELRDQQPIEQSRNITEMLNAHGVNPTKQRRLIADVLFARNQHVTADQLFDAVKQTGSRVSKATVYNTLGLFARKKLIREIFIDATRTFYDSNNSHHHHFYNVDTGDLIDIKERLAPHFLGPNLPDGTAMEVVDLVIRVKNKKR
ncbi:MAG: Fur family transcriptional regulator [Candidatus Thiodiazotropha sp. LLP2]